MTAVIVGGDHIASYREYLNRRGYAPVRHWDGRRGSDSRRAIPVDMRLMVIMIDQVNTCGSRRATTSSISRRHMWISPFVTGMVRGVGFAASRWSATAPSRSARRRC